MNNHRDKHQVFVSLLVQLPHFLYFSMTLQLSFMTREKFDHNTCSDKETWFQMSSATKREVYFNNLLSVEMGKDPEGLAGYLLVYQAI